MWKWSQYLVLLLCDAILSHFMPFFGLNNSLQYCRTDPLIPDTDGWK